MALKTIHRKLITLILAGVAFVLPFLYMGSLKSVSAIGNPSFSCTSSEYNALWGILGTGSSPTNTKLQNNVGVKLFSSIGGAGDNCRIEFDIKAYGNLKSDDKKTAMEIILGDISNSSLPSNLRLRFYNFIEDQDESTASMVRRLSKDVNADFATAYSWFRPFTGGISTILGFITLIIFVFLGMMITVDLAYIVLPTFRNALDPADGSKPKYVSLEAYKAIKEVESSTEYKSSLSIYFKHKVLQLIVLAICLLYLVMGKIYDLVAWIIDSFSGVIG